MRRIERRRGNWRPWRDVLACAVPLSLLIVALALGGWAWRLDRVAYDLGMSLSPRSAPPEIVIVAIDDASVEAIGRWPWRRAVHATLLDRLAQARPKAIALDLVLSEPDADPEQDRHLALALARAAPVVLPVTWTAADALGPIASLRPLLPAMAAAAASAAVAAPSGAQAAPRLGVAEAAVDADGVLRHAFLHAGPQGRLQPHLALALLQAGGEAVSARLHTDDEMEFGQQRTARADPPGTLAAWQTAAAWQRDGRFLIRFVGAPGAVQRVSYVDVLRGAVPPERLAGRYLLVGMTAQGLGDTLATPVNAWHRAMPGVEVLANTLYTLRSGDGVRALDGALVAVISVLALWAMVLSFSRFSPRLALPTALASVPLAVVASLLALRGGLWFSPVPFVAAAVLAYPMWSWRRLERAAAELDAEIARLDSEWLGERSDARAVRPRGGDNLSMRLQTLQRAGRLARQARSLLVDSLAAMPAAILVADERLRVTLANAKAADLFGTGQADELHGLDLVRLLDELTASAGFAWSPALATLQPGAAGVAVEGHLAESGDFVLHAAAVKIQGQRGWVVAIADVQPVKQAQREREEALAFVSHDLRSPASSIVLLSDMMLRGDSTTTTHEGLREIRRLAARTLQLSDDFVRASQARSQPLHLESLSAAECVQAALADMRAPAQVAGVELQDGAVEVAVLADRMLLTRALGNLLSNAIKHSPRGAAVRLAVLRDEAMVVFRVRDQGPGLSAPQRAQIERGDEGVAVRDARGVGLGLLFVQRVAQRHGGRLRASLPESGPGAQFDLQLPA